MPPEIVLFVFRRRGTRTISVRRTCLDAGNLGGSLWGMPRRRKTKRRGTICVLPYKQATPAGFAVEATNSQPYARLSEMWVMTRRLRPFLVQAPSSLRIIDIHAS